MKKRLYIIPGWTETCRRKPYKTLATFANEKGYEVICIKVNWKQKLSEQFFDIESNAIVFGFSLGAILARLVAQNNTCKKLILASMTPLEGFGKDKKTREALVELLGEEFVHDVQISLKKTHRAQKQVMLYGEKEASPKQIETADIIVPKTGHELSLVYLEKLQKLL